MIAFTTRVTSGDSRELVAWCPGAGARGSSRTVLELGWGEEVVWVCGAGARTPGPEEGSGAAGEFACGVPLISSASGSTLVPQAERIRERNATSIASFFSG